MHLGGLYKGLLWEALQFPIRIVEPRPGRRRRRCPLYVLDLLPFHGILLLVPQRRSASCRSYANTGKQYAEHRPHREGKDLVGVVINGVYVVAGENSQQKEEPNKGSGNDGSQPKPTVRAEDRRDGCVGWAWFEPYGSKEVLGMEGCGLLVSCDEDLELELEAGDVGWGAGEREEKVEHGEVRRVLEDGDEEDARWGRRGWSGGSVDEFSEDGDERSDATASTDHH